MFRKHACFHICQSRNTQEESPRDRDRLEALVTCRIFMCTYKERDEFWSKADTCTCTVHGGGLRSLAVGVGGVCVCVWGLMGVQWWLPCCEGVWFRVCLCVCVYVCVCARACVHVCICMFVGSCVRSKVSLCTRGLCA